MSGWQNLSDPVGAVMMVSAGAVVLVFLLAVLIAGAIASVWKR